MGFLRYDGFGPPRSSQYEKERFFDGKGPLIVLAATLVLFLAIWLWAGLGVAIFSMVIGVITIAVGAPFFLVDNT